MFVYVVQVEKTFLFWGLKFYYYLIVSLCCVQSMILFLSLFFNLLRFSCISSSCISSQFLYIFIVYLEVYLLIFGSGPSIPLVFFDLCDLFNSERWKISLTSMCLSASFYILLIIEDIFNIYELFCLMYISLYSTELDFLNLFKNIFSL